VAKEASVASSSFLLSVACEGILSVRNLGHMSMNDECQCCCLLLSVVVIFYVDTDSR
jgi:hypothetical protein